MASRDDGDIEGMFNEAFGGGKGFGPGTKGIPPGFAILLEGLSVAGQHIITGDEVETHEGKKILIPEGMTYERVQSILDRLRADAETPTSFDHQFLYRPDDGAHATYQVLRKRYGAVLGDSIQSFFGTMPAQTRTVAIAHDMSIQVPWGSIVIPTLPEVDFMLCDLHPHVDYGEVFELHIRAPKKHKAEIEEIIAEIEAYLREHSIYRGKVVVGSERPEFLDLSGFDASKIVFSDEVDQQFQAGVMTVLRHTQSLRDEGVPLKQAVLLYGPHGTGKTSAMQIISQVAVENGWTAIFAKTGEDDLEDALVMARQYMPAVIFVEDIDVEASSGEDNEVRRLLEAFDGITAKGGELVMVMTTNHIDRIHKGMLRPGRFDFTIEIESLDRGGVERLIKAVVPSAKLDSEVDYDTVYQAMEGFTPAFVRGACDRAVTFAIGRLGGKRGYTITTDDLVNAATSLRSQLKLQQDAGYGEKPPAMDAALGAVLEPVLKEVLSRTTGYSPAIGDIALTVGSPNGNHAS